MIDQGRSIGGPQRNSQNDAIFAPHEGVGDRFVTARDGLNLKPPPKERMGRIDDFGPIRRLAARVVEMGINKWSGLTTWIGT